MSRKSISIIFLAFLVVSLALAGCKRSATTPLEELPPEDETAATIQEAQQNTEAIEGTSTAEPEGEPEDVSGTPEPEATVTEEAQATPEPTAVLITEATPEPSPESTTEAMAEPVVAATPGQHIVQAGENLFRIALRYGTTVDAIAQANGITNAALIYVGQVLTIPSGAVVPPQQPPSGGEVSHTVQPGENLFRIALRYNYDQYYIARYNGIGNPSLIYVGQVIRIPVN